MSSRIQAHVLPGRHRDVDAALQILPAPANCPRELYRELLECGSSDERRVVVVAAGDEPLAVVGLRRRQWSWELITNWVVPGHLFPVKPGQLAEALRAIEEPLFISWWRQQQSPPTGLPIRGLRRVPTHGTQLEVDLDAMWRELGLSRSLKQARERTRGFELEVNAPGACEWVIGKWVERWQGPGAGETPELLDRVTVARHLEQVGQHFTLTLRHGDRWVAGNTNVVHGCDFVCQTSWRDLDYASHNVGVRLEELSFRWAQQAGFRYYDLGGGHAYKRKWAPVAGERCEFECATAAGFLFRRAVHWLGQPIAKLCAWPARVKGGLLGLGEPLHAAASGLGEMAVEVAPLLHF